VEIRASALSLPAQIDQLRAWLILGGCNTVTATGSSSETVLLVEFTSELDAEDLARRFGEH